MSTRDYSELSSKTHIALIHETWRQSVARDLTTAAIFLVLWSIGHFAESAALEWTGVIIAWFVVMGRVIALFKGTIDKRMTPEQAREWLDQHFPEPRS